jgi:hypothetical protein
VAAAGDTVNNVEFAFVDFPVINNDRHIAFTVTLLSGANAVFTASPDDSSLASGGWMTPSHGTSLPPQRMKEARAKNDLLRSKWGKPHSSAHVKVISQ